MVINYNKVSATDSMFYVHQKQDMWKFTTEYTKKFLFVLHSVCGSKQYKMATDDKCTKIPVIRDDSDICGLY